MTDLRELEKRLAPKARDVMRHALGLNRGEAEYRNYFCTGPGSDDWDTWEGLVAKGLAGRRGPSQVHGGDYIFHVTDEGRALIAKGDRHD